MPTEAPQAAPEAAPAPVPPAAKKRAKKAPVAQKVTVTKTPPANALVRNKLSVGRILFAVHVPAHSLCVVDSSAFDQLAPSGKAQAFAKLQAAGAQVVRWEADFNRYNDMLELRAQLLRGEDVSEQLMFHGVALPDSYLRVRAEWLEQQGVVRQLLATITPPYPWAAVPAKGGSSKLVFDGDVVRRDHYRMRAANIKKIWDKAYPFWANAALKTAPTVGEVQTEGNGTRHVTINRQNVSVGCQSIPRWQFEQAAVHYGWAVRE